MAAGIRRSAWQVEEAEEVLGLIQRKQNVKKNPLRIPLFCLALLLPVVKEQNPIMELCLKQLCFYFSQFKVNFKAFSSFKFTRESMETDLQIGREMQPRPHSSSCTASALTEPVCGKGYCCGK